MSKDIEFVKKRANFIRYSFIEEMEKHLLAFESGITSSGISVHWIADEEDLVEDIRSIMPKNKYNKVTFDTDYIPEELLNSSFIKQISVDDFENNREIPDSLFIKADYGIVETASLVFFDKKSFNNFNKIEKLIVLLDLNKLLVKQSDLESILLLKNDYSSKTVIPPDIKMISAPFQRIISNDFVSDTGDNVNKEKVEVIVILYDNGISTILENKFLRQSLYCIECGRCKNVCPVYAQTGKHSPIDLIKNNCIEQNLRDQNIFQNTTLCGNCNQVCPVQIPLKDLLITEMEMAAYKASREKIIDYTKIFAKRSRMNKLNNKLRRYFFVRKYFGKNKKLATYFKNKKEPFYNIIQTSQK